MLAVAPVTDGIEYVCAQAETLPFPDAGFPLITVSMAFHWFDRDRFLTEANRLLAPGGWLVLYGYNYTKSMRDEPGFATWVSEQLLQRYPLGARNGTPVTDDELTGHGLAPRGRTEFTEFRSYSLDGYTRNVLTHSYVISRVEGGQETLEDATKWLRAGLAPFFRDATERDFEFSGWMTWVQKSATRRPAVGDGAIDLDSRRAPRL